MSKLEQMPKIQLRVHNGKLQMREWLLPLRGVRISPRWSAWVDADYSGDLLAFEVLYKAIRSLGLRACYIELDPFNED